MRADFSIFKLAFEVKMSGVVLPLISSKFMHISDISNILFAKRYGYGWVLEHILLT